MDTKQISDALDRIFNHDEKRIVFWNDPEGEFLEFVDRLPILTFGSVSVNILRLDKTSALEAKIRLEEEAPADRFLVYSPTEEPDYEKDWLLDIRFFSRSFRADKASILLDELGLSNQHLRLHLADRRKFFDNKERLQKLKSLVAADDTATDLDQKMIAVVVKAEQSELFNVIRTLFHSFAETAQDIDLDTAPAVWEQIEKFDLAVPFWQKVKTTFGYTEQEPNLKNFLIQLFVTDFAQQLKAGLPPALQHLQLPSGGRSNTVVCLAQWRDSSSKGTSYDRLSALVAALIKLQDRLDTFEIGDLIDVMTFRIVDQKIASSLCERVKNTADTINADEIRAIATRRQAGHWASLSASGAPEVLRKPLHAVYDALVASSEFFALRNQHQSSLDFANATALYRAYEKELYRYDQLYRHFCESADDTEAEGSDVLKPLRESVEACYVNWYLPTLGLSWGKFAEPASQLPLLTHWRIDEVPSQQHFFEEHVRRRLEEAENRKVYVIISDAFRYEAAEELSRELKGKYRFEANLTSQLGVLPSYTALGMASLLPHEKLAYKANGDVLIDGKPTMLLEQRNEILASREGIACKAADLMERKKEEGREFVSGKRVVYVYHNTIDATGESGSTDGKTFQAVRAAINELASLVTYIINNLNGNFILITADHGFLFNETAPGDPEKSKLQQKPGGTVAAKKRYLIGQHLPDHEAVWHGRTSITAEAEGDMEFWIPKAANRFHFLGGGRFIHGGAMPQEIVVPVITVRHIKGKAVKDTSTRSVTVHVLGSSHKITTNRHRFELIQMEPVSERVKPITLKVAIYEGEEPVTNIEAVTFDSASDKMEDRKKWVPLVLQDRQYNKKTSYYLILRDSKTNLEQQRVEVTIDKAFSDDF